MKVVVCGGRDFSDADLMCRMLYELHGQHGFTQIMQGGAAGADAIAKEWARGIPELKRYECKAEWAAKGRAAGPIRNARMMKWGPDLVVAFPTAASVGTWDMIARADAAGVASVVVLTA